MPTALFRRPLTVTVWVVLSAIVLVISPVLIGVGAVASAVTGDRRPLVLARVLIAYFAYELGTLIACGGLWMAGARRAAGLHWKLLRWFVGGLASQLVSALDITIAPDPSPEAEAALEADGPLVLLSRHAGPGDTLMLANRMLSSFDRRPSVVFKEALAIDPSIDLLSHRLPHAVLDTTDREECETEITRVSAELGPRGVLLLFPEGGNFSQERRRSALLKLSRDGRDREAARARQMPHVLPPHPVGAQCALDANPTAGVIFAAHTGLGLASHPRAWWREMPIGRTLRTRMWLVPAAEVPRDPDAQVEWLYDWWNRIDEWVSSEA